MLGVQGKVKYACSEEVPEPVDLQGSGFSVAFDPLDGSSIVDTNFTVGTIFGVWPGDKLTGITGRDQVYYLPHACIHLSSVSPWLTDLNTGTNLMSRLTGIPGRNEEYTTRIFKCQQRVTQMSASEWQ